MRLAAQKTLCCETGPSPSSPKDTHTLQAWACVRMCTRVCKEAGPIPGTVITLCDVLGKLRSLRSCVVSALGRRHSANMCTQDTLKTQLDAQNSYRARGRFQHTHQIWSAQMQECIISHSTLAGTDSTVCSNPVLRWRHVQASRRTDAHLRRAH